MIRPDVAPPAPWSFPVPERAALANGLDVLLFHRPGQHVISAGLVLDLPLGVEPRGLEGVATLALRCLDEGTHTHPGLSFSEALESEGAALAASAGLSATQVFLDVPARRLERALPLLAEAVIEPTLAAADVERHRDLRLAEIEQARANSAQRAGLEFRRATIDPASRAARAAGGEADSVAAITPGDVRRFHATHYGPGPWTLILAGDFAADPLPAIEAAFGGWSVATPAVAHERPAAAPPRLLVIDRPGAVQADVRIGRLGIGRGDPRWAALQIGTFALGGAFLSRLNKVLREERGYTYGVHVVNQPFREGGLSTLQGSFRTEVTGAAVAEALALLDVTSAPFTPSEISDAIAYAVGVAPLRYATASGVTEQVAGLAAAGLGPEYVDGYTQALRGVTPETATAAVGELLPPSGLTVVIVGDAAVLVEDLARAGVGDAEVLG